MLWNVDYTYAKVFHVAKGLDYANIFCGNLLDFEQAFVIADNFRSLRD
jgi:hypothetical protein